MHQESDKELLDIWHHKALPSFSGRFVSKISPATIHFVRKGSTENSSIPTIILYTNSFSNHDFPIEVRKLLSDPFPAEFRPSLRLAVAPSKLSRVLCPEKRPEAQTAFNTALGQVPIMGASIGIQATFVTSTLGGYVELDGELTGMTCHHMISEEETRPVGSFILTHASGREFYADAMWKDLDKLVQRMEECCTMCRHVLHKYEMDKPDGDINLQILSQEMNKCCLMCRSLIENKTRPVSVSSPLTPPWEKADGCSLCIDYLWTWSHLSSLRKEYKELPLGRFKATSGLCAELSEDGRSWIEMDWGIFDLKFWHSSIKDRMRDSKRRLYPNEHAMGAEVYTTGRSTGTKFGRINPAMVGVFERPQGSLALGIVESLKGPSFDWGAQGPGIMGDSGSWVLDRENDALYGMLWGSDGVGQARTALVTPIGDLLRHLKRVTGAKDISFPLLPGDPPGSKLY
jgi:hypothetical protein